MTRVYTEQGSIMIHPSEEWLQRYVALALPIVLRAMERTTGGDAVTHKAKKPESR